VFAVDQGDDSGAPEFSAGFPIDFAIFKDINTSAPPLVGTRLLQGARLETSNYNVEITDGSFKFDYSDSWYASGGLPDKYSWMFKRAKGFFDVVAYTGTGANTTVAHSLGVTPEMMIVKNRVNAGSNWATYHKDTLATKSLYLNNTSTGDVSINLWNNTDPTDSLFTVGIGGDTNGSANTLVAYLFATLAGVSKVGSYTGNGTSQTIDCGFAAGARFILIKRTDATGAWYIWDTTRGIVAGTESHLSLNSTAAQVTTDDSVDPDNSGFIVNQVSATNINVSSASYIFYAIA